MCIILYDTVTSITCMFVSHTHTHTHTSIQGMKHFNIIPTTFVLPEELGQFQGTDHTRCAQSTREREREVYHHPPSPSYLEEFIYIHMLCAVHFRKNRGVWIMKPVSSSRGRGITLINHVRVTRGREGGREGGRNGWMDGREREKGSPHTHCI